MSQLIKTDHKQDQARIVEPKTLKQKYNKYIYCYCKSVRPTKYKSYKGSDYEDSWSLYTATDTCKVCKKLTRKPTISGNNGSWTNTDDHDNARNDEQARIRIKREARTNRFRTGATNRKNVKYGPPEGTQADVFDDISLGLSTLDGEDVVILRKSYVRSQRCPYVTNGVDYFKKCGDVFISPLGEVADDIIRTNVLLKGTNNNGLFEHNDIKKEIYTKSVVNYFLFSARRESTGYYPSVRGWYCSLSADMLCHKLPCNGVPSLNRKKVMLGILSRDTKLPDDLLQGTVNYVFNRELMLTRGVITDVVTQAQMGQKLDQYDPHELALCRNLHIDSYFEGIRVVQGVDCQLPQNWLPKDTYSISYTGATGDLSVCPTRTTPYRYPRYDTDKRPGTSNRVKRTVMFSLVGSGDNFVTYDVSGVNACQALKRLCAARDNEQGLYANQMSLAAELNSVGIIKDVVLDTLKVKVSKKDFRAVVGHGVSSHRVFYNKFTDNKVVNAVRKFSNRVSPTLFERWTDNALNAAHGARWGAYKSFLEMCELQMGREYYAELPHVKKMLRKAYVKGVQLHDEADIMVERLEACVKKELAKHGKVPRFFVGYGPGALFASGLPSMYKKCLLHNFHFKKGELWEHGSASIIILSEPSSCLLQDAFQSLMDATNEDNFIQIVIYSDDSVYAGRCNGEAFGYNVDISSCDSSNNTLVFGLTGSLLANFNEPRAMGLLKQCMLPITCRNPDNTAEKIVVKFHSAFEGSGTVLTTILNHTASYLIAVNVISQLTDMNPQEAITQGAALAGHLVTTESWVFDGTPVYEKMQFLKMSPMCTTVGTWTYSQNLGCLLRSLGSIEGDMTAKMLNVSDATFNNMSWDERMDIFTTGVVNGYAPEPDNCILSALRARFAYGTVVVPAGTVISVLLQTNENGGGQQEMENRSGLQIDNVSLCRRYDIQEYDLDLLCSHIRSLQLGHDSITSAVGQIYSVDYGVPTGLEA